MQPVRSWDLLVEWTEFGMWLLIWLLLLSCWSVPTEQRSARLQSLSWGHLLDRLLKGLHCLSRRKLIGRRRKHVPLFSGLLLNR